MPRAGSLLAPASLSTDPVPSTAPPRPAASRPFLLLKGAPDNPPAFPRWSRQGTWEEADQSYSGPRGPGRGLARVHGVRPRQSAAAHPCCLRVPSGSSLPPQIEPVRPGGALHPSSAQGPRLSVQRAGSAQTDRARTTTPGRCGLPSPGPVSHTSPSSCFSFQPPPPSLPEVRKRQLSSQCSARPSFPGLPRVLCSLGSGGSGGGVAPRTEQVHVYAGLG